MTIAIAPVDDGVVAAGVTIAVDEDSVFAGVLSGSDPDGEAVTFTIATSPNLGTLILADAATGAFAYIPYPDTDGADSFTYEVSDGVGSPASGTGNITINPVNDAPRPQEGLVVVVETGTSTSGVLEAVDPDGDAATFRNVDPPTVGILNLNSDGTFVFDAADGEPGQYVFTFVAGDGVADSELTEVAIVITATGGGQTVAASSGCASLAGSGALWGLPLLGLRWRRKRKRVRRFVADRVSLPIWTPPSPWPVCLVAAGYTRATRRWRLQLWVDLQGPRGGDRSGG